VSLKSPTAVLLGYGSVGRYHAAILAGRYKRWAIVDLADEARARAADEHGGPVVAASLDELAAAGWDWDSTLAVIATLGPSHADLFHDLVRRGVRRILCEKPMADSLARADAMAKTAEERGVTLGLHMQYRYNELVDGVHELARRHDLGEIVSVLVHGGASCMVTNGIHYFDWACAQLGELPDAVTSTVRGEPINPRSPDLHYYGGTATWHFPSGREVTLIFSNQSSVAERIQVVYGDAVTHLTRFFDAEVVRRPPDEVARFNRVTRTGEANEVLYEGPVPDLLLDTAPSERTLDEIEEGAVVLLPPATAVEVLGGMIGALIAGRDGRRVPLPLSPGGPDGAERWPIS
jgi:predicted dehydrogenase